MDQRSSPPPPALALVTFQPSLGLYLFGPVVLYQGLSKGTPDQVWGHQLRVGYAPGTLRDGVPTTASSPNVGSPALDKGGGARTPVSETFSSTMPKEQAYLKATKPTSLLPFFAKEEGQIFQAPCFCIHTVPGPSVTLQGHIFLRQSPSGQVLHHGPALLAPPASEIKGGYPLSPVGSSDFSLFLNW